MFPKTRCEECSTRQRERRRGATIIKRHNNRVRNTPQDNDPAAKLCNCRGGVDVCPLNGECLTKGIVYEAKVIAKGAGNEMIYIGSTSTTFKERYNNHKASLKHEKKQSSTKLSKHVWELKRAGVNHTIKWRILRRAKEYSTLSKRCDLCLTEKLFILTARKETRLNSRTDLTSQCRHQKKQSLAHFAPPIR